PFSRGPLPPCFLANASLVLALQTLDPNVASLQSAYFAFTAQPLHQPVGLPVLNARFGITSVVCQTSLDGSEGFLLTQTSRGLAAPGPAGRTAASVALSNSNVVTTLITPQVRLPLLSQRATLSPFGAPFLDEWDVAALVRNGTLQLNLKVWGENGVNAKPFPF